MNTKKIYLLILALLAVVCLTFAACDKDPVPPPAPVVSGRPEPERTVTETKLVTYDGPELLTSSSKVGVKVEGEDLFVYETRVNHARSFTYTYSNDVAPVVIFDFEGKVNVEITVNGASVLTDVVVRPLDYGVEPAVSGNKISFELDYTDSYVVEYKTSSSDLAYKNAIHIFANPIETDPVDPDNVPDGTLYIGPGVWMADAIPISGDNQTIYIDGGAVVYGQIRTGNYKNITVRGHGIISGEVYDRLSANEFTLPIEMQYVDGLTIRDITILDPAGWAVTLYMCKNVTIDNLHIITARANGDGISVQSCQNVKVTNSFVRSWDDSLVVKNVDNESTSDITFDGVTVWTDLAQSMEVGYETYGPSMTNITFKNITVLHNFHKAAISMHNADQAQISNVTYQSVTIEDAQMLGDNQLDGDNDFLIDMNIAYNSEWTQSGGARGAIKNVTIDNVKVLNMADSIICRMYGEGAQSNIDGVHISNVEIRGKKATSLADMGLQPGVYTSDVTYVEGETCYGALKAYPYKLQLADDDVERTNKQSVSQQGVTVPDFAILDVEPSYAGVKTDIGGATVSATYGAGDKATSPWNEADAPSVAEHGTDKLTDGDRTSTWQLDGWRDTENEFVALSFDFGSTPKNIGLIRLFGNTDSKLVSEFTIAIYVKTLKGDVVQDWKRLGKGAVSYTITPQSSNFTTIQIAADNYYGIQLRIFRKNDLMSPLTYELGEVEFYPPSLVTGKAIVDSSTHEDVYDIGYILDGNTSTYYETKKGVFPAHFTVDMGQDYFVKYINIHLPPVLLWEPREQEIAIYGSKDGKTFFDVLAKAKYTFDPATGNMAALVLDTPIEMRYIKIEFSSNSTGYGGQISELYVYGE